VFNVSCNVQVGRKCYQQTSTTTNVVDDTASAASSTRTTVADKHKFSAVRHLSRRLLDRSNKCDFLSTPRAFGASWELIPSEFHQDFGNRKLEYLSDCLALFCVILSLIIFVQYRLVKDGRTDRQTNRRTNTAYTVLAMVTSSVTEDCLQTVYYHLQVPASDCAEVAYLPELCVPVTTTATRRHLRSAARGHLQVLATRTVTFRPAVLLPVPLYFGTVYHLHSKIRH